MKLRSLVLGENSFIFIPRASLVGLFLVFKVLGFLNILRLEVSVLVESVGFLERNGHGIEDIGRLLEDVIHFFEGPKTGLGEEEVNTGEHKSVAEGS